MTFRRAIIFLLSVALVSCANIDISKDTIDQVFKHGVTVEGKVLAVPRSNGDIEITVEQGKVVILGKTIPAPQQEGSPDFPVQGFSKSVYANPTINEAFTTNAEYIGWDEGWLNSATKVRVAGADHIFLMLPWGTCEATVGVYGCDTLVQRFVAHAGGLPLWVNFSAVVTGGVRSVPGSLSATAWDDPAMIDAYQDFITHYSALLGEKVFIWSAGNEIDQYFSSHTSEIAAYGTFLTQTRTHARSVFGTNPFKYSVSITFDSADELATTYAAISNALPELMTFTFYFIGTTCFDGCANSALEDLQFAAAYAGRRPYAYQELGYSTAPELGGDPAVQQFVLQSTMAFLDALVEAGYPLIAATLFNLSNWDVAILEEQGFTPPLSQFFAGIGLRDDGNQPQPIWPFVAAWMGGTTSDPPPVDPVDCTMSFTEPASETFSALAGSGSVVVNLVTSSCDFFVQIPGGETWLSVSPTASSGTATLTYTLTANSDTATRDATFEVVNSENDILSFEIVQQGSDPLPSNPPAAANTPSPADGATGVDLGAPLSANEADDYVSCSILFDTVSPPVDEIDLGTTCTYAPPSTDYSTQYFWILKRTNAYGTTASAEWDFTTKADPTPVDPDPTCLSTTTSATGYNAVHWTPCRQDAWDQMEADYIAACPAGVSAVVCVATPATWGGRLFKENKRIADNPALIAVPSRFGDQDAFIVQATGCATMNPSNTTYAARAYTNLLGAMNASMPGTEAAPYNFVYITDNNAKRINPLKFLAILDAIKPCITTAQFDALNLKLAQFLQSVRLNGWAHSGLDITDWDNAIGGCFGIWAHYYRNPTMPLAIENFTNYNPVTGIALNNIGGLDPVANPATFRPDVAGATCRDVIKWYLTITPNGSAESGEYDLATVTFLVRGWDAMRTITGEDHFPEILTALEGTADQLLHMWTPDLLIHYDWSDTEHPHAGWARAATTVGLLELAGALEGTTRGRKVHDLIVELSALYPLGQHLGLGLYPYGSTPLTFYNPYDTQVEWRSALTYFDAAHRITSRRSHVSSTTASQLFVYSGGPEKWNTALGFPQSMDHNGQTFGDWTLYCDGGWCVNHPFDYGGPYQQGADGGNVPIIQGKSKLNGYNRLTAAHGASYSSVLAQQGGSLKHDGYCGASPANAPPYLNEWTRSIVYVPGDTVIVFDRGDVESTVVNYTTCYHGQTQRPHLDPFKNIDKELIINHTYTSPTQNTNVFTWTTEDSKNAKMSFLFPTANLDHTIVDESVPASFGYTWTYDATRTRWQYHYQFHQTQLRYHVRSRVTTDLQFNTFLSVHQFGAETAGTLVALEDAGKVQGVHVNPATGNDVVAMFNSQQGAITLDNNYYDPDHQTQVPQQHLRETGFTFTYTPTTANSLWLFHGLNPANTWSYTIDGGASVPFTPEDGNVDGEVPGHWSGTIAVSTGAPRVIVVTGS